MEIEEINTDRDKFLEAVSRNVEGELRKIGLRLINVNVTDINDDSGYIEALGREAAAKAINDAKKSVAEKNRDGESGAAQARSEQRISVARAESEAIEGENTAKIAIAGSDSIRREREAEAQRRAVAAEKSQHAKALEEAYSAEQLAEQARAQRETATQQADIIVKSKIQKEQIEIQAEASAEQRRRTARGEADAIFATMEAQGRGMQEILSKQAAGFQKVVEAAGGDAGNAIQLMLVDKIEDLVKIQVEAIKNLQIDKITVWDSMGGAGDSPTTANFLAGMMRSIPPLSEMFKMAGMAIPGFLGADAPPEEQAPPGAIPGSLPAASHAGAAQEAPQATGGG
jgi:flotillin